MSLTSDQITAQNFKDFYGQIRPYLNGQVPTFANQFSRSDLYSTDEKIIGCFTDGKPIYQKTLLLSLSDFSGSGGVRYYDVRSLNIDTPISAKGYYNYNNTVKMTFPDIEVTGSGFNSSYSASVMLRNSDNANGLVLWLQDSALSAFKDCAITIQYTKKSDSAIKVGTGTDYSTDEQIIGTWIDGKPLYQKSYTGTCNANSMVVDANFNDTYIDNVVEMVGYSKQYNTSYHKYFWTNTYYQDANDNFRLSVHPDNGLTINGGSNYPLKPYTYIITIRYTKTTD